MGRGDESYLASIGELLPEDSMQGMVSAGLQLGG